MSLTASYVIIIVMVIRLLLKRCPKIFSYALWSVVLFRLICPFSIEGTYSLMPVNTQAVKSDIIYSESPQINTGIAVVDRTLNFSLPTPITPVVSINPMQIWVFIGELIWITGIILLGMYSFFSTVKLHRRLKFAIHYSENIYVVKGIQTPFVFGIIKPKIYLPLYLTEKEQEYIILHEQKHISRFDHIIKLFAFFVLCVYWFNPLVWIAFFLMGEDMELSCDESVIKQLGSGIKKEYSSSLLSLSTRRRIVGGSPLAFGENNTKSRIKNVLNYKKPSFWVIIVTAIVVVALGVGLMMNPKNAESDLINSSVEPFDNKYTAVSMIEIENGIESDQNDIVNIEDVKKIYELLQTAVASSKNGSQDVPYDKDYIHVSFRPSDGLADYFMYKENGKYFLVQPYNGKWEISYDIMKEIVTKFTSVSNDNVTSAIVMEELLTAHFETVMSKPKTSSNPKDYIKANQSIFDEIVSYGDSALIYCFKLFEQGGQTDLKGQLMMMVCLAIQPEAEDAIGYDNGQMWYDEFKKRAFHLKESNSIMDDIEKYYPTYYLLLKLLSEGFMNVSDEIRLPNFTYSGNDEILKLIYETEIDKGYYRNDGFLIPAIHLHGSYEEENKLKVFVTIYDDYYKLYGDKVKSVGGSVIPIAITYTKDKSGNYILEEYLQCEDGARFGPSIESFSTYPVSGKKISGLAEKIISHYSDYEDLKQLQRMNLIEHLNHHNQTGISIVTDYDDSVAPLN